MDGTSRGILSGRYRALTLGIVLSITYAAFSQLAVAPVAPIIARDLGGLALYGWIFSGAGLASLVGTVAAGRQVDRRGPGVPYSIGLLVSGAGLLVTASAPSMLVLILGRALGGLGGGVLFTCVYAALNLGYPDELRPRMLAAVSSAFIVPALVGPYFAGVIAEHLSWRVVFWGMLPFLLAAAILTRPSLRRLRPEGDPAPRPGIVAALRLAAGAGLLLTGLGMLPEVLGLLLSCAGLLMAVSPLRGLLPAGTLVARPGLPSAIAARGLFSAGYFMAEAYIVLALTALAGYTPSAAGLVVAVGALSWSASSWLQARLDGRDGGAGRRGRIIAGVALLLAGISLMATAVWAPDLALVLAIGGHLLSGLGMGQAHPTSAAVAFARAPGGEEGSVSSGMLLADNLTIALGIGAGGALLAVSEASGWGTQPGVAAAFAVALSLIALSLLASSRLPRESRPMSAGPQEGVQV